jgi:hypothetical protein
MKNEFNRKNMNSNMNNDENKLRMNARERRINAKFISKAILAATVIMTVISRNLPAVIKWIKALSRADDQQKLTLKGLFCATIGEAALIGMPTATRNLLMGLSAPRAIVALTSNKKVVWLLNYVEDSYSSMNVKQLLTITGQVAALGATLEDEMNKKSYLQLDEPMEMTTEEIENM